MPDETQLETCRSTLSRLGTAVGNKVLAYMLACTTDEIDAMIAGTASPGNERIEAIRQLAPVLQTVPEELDTDRIDLAIRHWLTALGDDGRSIVRRVREHLAGPEVVVARVNELERLIASIAIDVYPTFLFPPDDRIPREFRALAAPSPAFSHPDTERFCAAVLRDDILGRAFTNETRHGGRSGTLLANTGSGGGLQLSMLPTVLLANSWVTLMSDGVSPHVFASRAVEELRFARAVLSGETRMISVRVAFTGILLPEGASLELANGDVVRPITDMERQLASLPEDARGRASHTDSSGRSATINYEGDLVLVHQFPYRVRIGDPNDESVSGRYDDPEPHAVLQRIVAHLRFSLILAVEREAQSSDR